MQRQRAADDLGIARQDGGIDGMAGQFMQLVFGGAVEIILRHARSLAPLAAQEASGIVQEFAPQRVGVEFGMTLHQDHQAAFAGG